MKAQLRKNGCIHIIAENAIEAFAIKYLSEKDENIKLSYIVLDLSILENKPLSGGMAHPNNPFPLGD